MGRGSCSSGGRGSSSSGGGSGFSSSRGWSRSSYSRSRSSSSSIRSSGSSSYSSSSGSGAPPVILGIIFLIFGIAIIAAGLAGFIKAGKYSTTYGTAIENNNAHGWYYTTYSYYVDGESYVNESQEGWEYPETVGKTVKLYYLKSNPNYITEKDPANTDDGPVIIIIGCVFGGIGLDLTIYSINAKREDKKQLAEAKEDKPLPLLFNNTDNKIACPYCGTKYNKNSTSCPNCGASNK